jgi:hypothetical protein
MRDCPKERTDYRVDITCRNCEYLPVKRKSDLLLTTGPHFPRLSHQGSLWLSQLRVSFFSVFRAKISEDGHHSKDCTNPPNPDLMTCRNCNGTGHMKIDCPEPPKFSCRNCDQEGHRSSECPVPPITAVIDYRNPPIWQKFNAKNVRIWAISQEIVPTRNVATARNQVIQLASVLYPPPHFHKRRYN